MRPLFFMGNYLKKWIEHARPRSLMQSMMPAVLATICAIGSKKFNILCGFAAILGVVCAHLALNLADDWFDYRIDMMGDRDKVIRQGFRAMSVKYPYFTDGSETPRSAAAAIATFGGIALTCGLGIFIYRTVGCGFGGAQGSWIILAITAACAFLGMFYSAPPLKLSFRGLGEMVIGFFFGPLLMWGVYYSTAGSIDAGISFVSIPVGLLVLNILFTHSFIDMEGDAASNKMTFARLLGNRKLCLAASYIFTFVPFIMIVIAVATGVLHPIYLIVLLVIPRGIWLCHSLHCFSADSSHKNEIPDQPYRWLGPMAKNWDIVREKGVDWFLMRWLCARNILSGFCAMMIISKVITLIIG